MYCTIKFNKYLLQQKWFFVDNLNTYLLLFFLFEVFSKYLVSYVILILGHFLLDSWNNKNNSIVSVYCDTWRTDIHLETHKCLQNSNIKYVTYKEFQIMSSILSHPIKQSHYILIISFLNIVFLNFQNLIVKNLVKGLTPPCNIFCK